MPLFRLFFPSRLTRVGRGETGGEPAVRLDGPELLPGQLNQVLPRLGHHQAHDALWGQRQLRRPRHHRTVRAFSVAVYVVFFFFVFFPLPTMARLSSARMMSIDVHELIEEGVRLCRCGPGLV